MAALLAILLLLIGTYWFVTDPRRVRRMAESYLSDLLGGHVRVGGATLSIFEGLHLSRVSVTVPGDEAIDSTLFVVDSLDVQYNPASLFRGRLEATRLIATGPHVYLVENLADSTWNYQRLRRLVGLRRGTRSPGMSGVPVSLPEVVIRNARVEYSELRDGRYTSRGVMGLEGRLSPSTERNQYLFELQSRGATEGVGPVLAGDVRLNTGRVTASLQNLAFGPDILAMLPSEVRQLWQSHRLQGRLDIPVFDYVPKSKTVKASFLLKTEFRKVRLVIRPQELASGAVARRLNDLEAECARFTRQGFVFEPVGDALKRLAVPPDLAVENVTGTYRFDSDRMSFDGVTATVEGIPLVMSGKAEGYSPDVPFHIHVQSPQGQLVQLQSQLQYLSALPPVARTVYEMFRPSGYCTFEGDLDRPTSGAKPRVVGHLDILDGAFVCEFFKYPMRHVTGRLALADDEITGDERLTLDHLQGNGVAAGPNAKTRVAIDGWVGPFDHRLGCDVMISSPHVVSDDAFVAAFPPEVRDALASFRSESTNNGVPRPYPDFDGSFRCRVAMPIAVGSRVTLTTDIQLKKAAGQLLAFPYPFRNATGDLHVDDGRLDVMNLGTRDHDTAIGFNGTVFWPTPQHPRPEISSNITLHATSIPIDATLLAALPPEKARALQNVHLGGRLDVDGTLTSHSPLNVDGQPRVVPIGDGFTFAIDLGLRDALVKTTADVVEADHVNGTLHLTPDGVTTKRLTARRGPAVLDGSAAMSWAGGHNVTQIKATARNLVLDASLHDLLPPAATSAWDALRPQGKIDAELSLLRGGPSPDFTLVVRPDRTHIEPAFFPLALDDCLGSIIVTPARTTIDSFSASHGNGRLTLSGTGDNGTASAWDLSLRAEHLETDDALRKALPPVLSALLEKVSMRGPVTVALSKFNYRAGAGRLADTANADVVGRLKSEHGSLDLGIPVQNVDGELSFNAAVRDGALATMTGKLSAASLELAGRSVQNLSADVERPLGEPSLNVRHVAGQVAGGNFAGDATLHFPENAPNRYSLNFVVRNADVHDIARQSADVAGQLSASLALEGTINQPATRRGRGDVQVVGKRMYQIPLLLGLMEVTDLALPSANPFNEATARYNVDGLRINFDQIQMRSASMLMSGGGYMDFGSKKVRMNFTTDNANLPQLPFLHELWQGAKQEMLQIQVRGTILEPKVNAASLHTFRTTVDEVLTGHDRER